MDASKTFVDVNAASGLLLDFVHFRCRVLVLVLHAQFAHEDLDVEVVSDLLTIEEQLLHLDAALSEVLLQVELLLFILTHIHVAKIVTCALLLALFSLFLLLSLSCGRLFFGSDGLRVARSEVDGLLDERLHHEDVQVEFLTNELRLLLLASEGVANHADLGRQPARIHWVLQLRALLKVNFNDLLEGISKQKVVVGLVRDLKLSLVKLHFGLGALRWRLSFALGVELGRRVEDLVETGLSLGHDISSPLSLVLEVVNQL